MEKKVNEVFSGLTWYNTVFYPFSGADFSKIHEFIEYSNRCICNFIYVDSCIKEDAENGKYDKRLDFIDNQLGLQNLEIISKGEFSIDSLSEITASKELFLSIQSKEYNSLFSKIHAPKLVLYQLKSPVHNSITLLFFEYESAALLFYLQSFVPALFEQDLGFPSHCALILNRQFVQFSCTPFWEFINTKYQPFFIVDNLPGDFKPISDYNRSDGYEFHFENFSTRWQSNKAIRIFKILTGQII